MSRTVRDRDVRRAYLSLASATFIAVLVAFSGCSPSAGSHTTNPAPLGAELVMSDVARDTDPKLSEQDAASLAAGNRAFACDLYRELAAKPGNLFFSPYSISVALAMTYAGADGDTRSEIRAALHFDLDEPALHSVFNATTRRIDGRAMEVNSAAKAGEGFELSILNQAWGQKGFKFEDGYLDVLAQHYGSGLFLLDFAKPSSRDTINGWVAEQTHQHINDLLPQGAITALTRLVLTNAVYFKASWFNAFKSSDTTDGLFQTLEGARSVEMMHATQMLQFAEGANYQAVELPYASDAVRMLIIAPEPSAFAEISGGIDPTLLSEIQGKLSEGRVTLTMPRWSFGSNLELPALLQALGMRKAFTSDADFSRLTEMQDLYVTGAFHDAFVSVDEQGTEAAAATAVVIGRKSVSPSVTVTLDRPFLFVIYDAPTSQLLFVGRLMDPSLH